MDDQTALLQDLFRQEFSKMVAVITRLYGLQHIGIAEDMVSETFLQATESWREKKIPANPRAWLYKVAGRKTLYYFRRNRIFQEKVLPALKGASGETLPEDGHFSEQNIKDAQLQMMFAVCDPVIASEAQIGLALRILCGFTVEEIAEAFLTNKETVYKRLNRAKEKLKEAKITLGFPSAGAAGKRLDNVLHILYLLFNEGYYSITQTQVLRAELCAEALRLAVLLTEFTETNQPKTAALIAMMCFHASRFNARQTGSPHPILYHDQDESLWDRNLIRTGMDYLERSAQEEELSSYHLEAGIAFWHCQKDETAEKWSNILYYFDLLLQINNSPVVALNRLYALYRMKGKEAALMEVSTLPAQNNHFYFTLLGELYTGIDNTKAITSFQRALALAKTETDKQTVAAKIGNLAN